MSYHAVGIANAMKLLIWMAAPGVHGARTADAHERPMRPGKIGFWTKADSVIAFDTWRFQFPDGENNEQKFWNSYASYSFDRGIRGSWAADAGGVRPGSEDSRQTGRFQGERTEDQYPAERSESERRRGPHAHTLRIWRMAGDDQGRRRNERDDGRPGPHRGRGESRNVGAA